MKEYDILGGQNVLWPSYIIIIIIIIIIIKPG